MSDSSPPDSAVSPGRLPRKSLGALTMLIVVGGWLLALGGWMAWHLFSQVKEMKTFTDPAPQAIRPVAPAGEVMEELRGRMSAFAAAMDAKQPAVLEFSVADLNYLLAAQEPLNRLQDIAKVEEITDVIRVKVALALNGVPFSGERLYLNGFIDVRPELKKEQDPKKNIGVVLLTRALEVPGRQLSQGFTQRYLEANHMDSLALDEVRKNDRLNTILKSVTSVRCEPGKVVAEYAPAAPAPAKVPPTAPAP